MIKAQLVKKKRHPFFPLFGWWTHIPCDLTGLCEGLEGGHFPNIWNRCRSRTGQVGSVYKLCSNCLSALFYRRTGISMAHSFHGYSLNPGYSLNLVHQLILIHVFRIHSTEVLGQLHGENESGK